MFKKIRFTCLLLLVLCLLLLAGCQAKSGNPEESDVPSETGETYPIEIQDPILMGSAQLEDYMVVLRMYDNRIGESIQKEIQLDVLDIN